MTSKRQAQIDARVAEIHGPRELTASTLEKHVGHRLAVFVGGPTDVPNMPFPLGDIGIECVTCRVPDPKWGGYTPLVIARMGR